MKEHKSSLNDSGEVSPRRPEEVQIEKQLLPRLRFMGLLLFFFSGCALCYSIFFAAEIDQELALALANDEFTTPQEMQYASGLSITENTPFSLFQAERFNAYMVTISFAVVGAACLFTAWSKQKKLVGK